MAMSMQHALLAVESELLHAILRHKKLNSHHEAYSVILEELDEYWENVKMGGNELEARPAHLRKELTHTAAMAVRALMDLCEEEL